MIQKNGCVGPESLLNLFHLFGVLLLFLFNAATKQLQAALWEENILLPYSSFLAYLHIHNQTSLSSLVHDCLVCPQMERLCRESVILESARGRG